MTTRGWRGLRKASQRFESVWRSSLRRRLLSQLSYFVPNRVNGASELGKRGQMGEGSCVERENAFLRISEHLDHFQRKGHRYLALAKEIAFAAPLLPVCKDPVSVCTPHLSDPVWGRRTSCGAAVLTGDTGGRAWREGER